MILCDCSWDVPGVEALPAHTHPSHLQRTDEGIALVAVEVHFWVPWKEVARQLAQEAAA
jgi:hypothetical protein